MSHCDFDDNVIALQRMLRFLEEEARTAGLPETARLIGAAEMVLTEQIATICVSLRADPATSPV